METSKIENQFITIDNLGDIHHISKVLRLAEGDVIDVSDLSKFDYKCEITLIDKDKVIGKILEKKLFLCEPKNKITLFQGVPKHGKLDLVIQKNVELGIYEIIPVFMDRTVIAYKDKFNKKIERFNTISIEASKQCKRGIVPKVQEAIDFNEAIKHMEKFNIIIFPYENENVVNIKEVLRDIDLEEKEIAIIIGPEGGFSDQEVDMLKEINACSVSLGKTILRTETASIATVAMAMYELEL